MPPPLLLPVEEPWHPGRLTKMEQMKPKITYKANSLVMLPLHVVYFQYYINVHSSTKCTFQLLTGLLLCKLEKFRANVKYWIYFS